MIKENNNLINIPSNNLIFTYKSKTPIHSSLKELSTSKDLYLKNSHQYHIKNDYNLNEKIKI